MATLLSDDKATYSETLKIRTNLRLRITESDKVIERFDLPVGKCTIGSSPSCQIRLEGGRVRPLQCLIVRKEDQFTVTRWAAGILLNGQDFTSASFGVGDALTVGDYRLELVSEDQADHTPQPDQSPVELIDQVAAQVAAEVALNTVGEASPEVEPSDAPEKRPCELVEAAQTPGTSHHDRKRLRRFLGSFRELREHARALDQQVDHLTQQVQTARAIREQLAAELHQTQAIASERESQFGEELDRAIAELSSSYAKITATEQQLISAQTMNQQLQEQVSAMSAELRQLQVLQATLAGDNERLQLELANRESHVQQLQVEVQQLQETLQATIADLQRQNEELRKEQAEALGEREKQIAQVRQELEVSVHELHGQNDSLRVQVAQIAAERDQQVTELQTNYQTHLNDLQAQNEALRNQVEELANQYDQQLTEARNAFQSQLAEQYEVFNGQFSQARSEWDQQLADERARFESQLAELTGQNEALTGQISDLAGGYDRQMAEFQAGFQAQLDAAQGENENLRQQVADLLQERDRQTEHQQSLDATVAELRSQNESLQKQLSDSCAEKERAIEAIRREMEQIPLDLEQELTELRSERQILAEEKHRLSNKLEDAEKKIQLLEIDVRSLNSEWQHSQSLVAQLQDDLLTAQAHTADLDAKLADFQCSAEVERAVECDQLTGSMTTLQQRINEREAALAAITAEREELATKLATTQQELCDCQNRISELCEDVDRLNASSLAAQSEQSRLTSILAERDAQIQALTAEMQRISDQMQPALRHKEEQVRELTSQVEMSQQKFLELTEAKNSEIGEYRDKLNQAETNFQTKLATKEAELVALREQIGQLKEEITREIELRDAQLKDLNQTLNDQQQQLALAAEANDQRIENLVAERRLIEEQFRSELAAKESLLAESQAEVRSLREQLTSEIETRDAQIAEINQSLRDQQQQLTDAASINEEITEKFDDERLKVEAQFKAELSAKEQEIKSRETQIAQLTQALEQSQSQVSSEARSEQSSLDDLASKLSEVTERSAAELRDRDERIARLTEELAKTQDQLNSLVSQRQQLSGLYQQSEAELTELKAVENSSSARTQAPPQEGSYEDTVRNDFSAPASFAVQKETAPQEAPQQSFQPTSFIERYSHIFEETVGPEPEAPAEQISPSVLRSQPEPLDSHGDDSDALEAYMANMMKRVRGETSSDDIAPPVSRLTAEPSSELSNPVARMDTLTRRVSATTVEEPCKEEKLIDLKELKETSQKPPLPTDLSAMRELANTSARQAIAKHRKRRHFEGALSKFLVSGIAGSTAGYMLMTADNYLSPYFLAGCGVGIVSGYWGFKLLLILIELIRDGLRSESTPAELSITDVPLPIVPDDK